MCASIPLPMTRIRRCAREIEAIGHQIAMVAELVDAVEERIGDHHGGNITVNDRATAMLVATTHLLRNVRAQTDALVDRMLDASEA